MIMNIQNNYLGLDMATIFTLVCKTGSNEVALEITDSLIPFPGMDTWKCDDEKKWGIASGAVASWGTKTTFLHGIGSSPVATLENFSKSTSVGDVGEGEKLYIDGTFPIGDFSWSCISKI